MYASISWENAANFAKWFAFESTRFTFRGAMRVTGVFIGSNLASGYCLLHTPKIIYLLNYRFTSDKLGFNYFFASSSSLISLGYTYQWVDLSARAVGSAVGYAIADAIADFVLIIFHRLSSSVLAKETEDQAK